MVQDTLYQSLVNASLRFVSYRPRSRKELTGFLQKKLAKWKKEGGSTLEKVLERFTELGYIDDRKFASWWVEQRNAFRPKGTKLLGLELYQKGIDRTLIEEVLAEMEIDEVSAARLVVEKKRPRLRHLPKAEQKARLYGMLARRGFSGQTIRTVVDGSPGREV